MTPFRDHVTGVINQYRDSIEAGHFEEVDRALGQRRWEPRGIVPPVPASITEKASVFFDDLHGAVANRDRESAAAIIERIRRWLHNIAL